MTINMDKYTLIINVNNLVNTLFKVLRVVFFLESLIIINFCYEGFR